MKRILPIITSLLLAAGCASEPQVLERELGTFDLKLGTEPARSMAQGLVQPSTGNAFHGGLDLTHASGLYVGQWSPSVGLVDGRQLEVNSYLGYAQQNDHDQLGYEIGLMRYSFPELPEWDRHEYYSGLTLGDRRLGAALNSAAGRTDRTLYLDLGTVTPFAVGVRVKYSSHALAAPHYLGGGDSVDLFSDWSLDLSRPWLGLQLNLSYSDSSLSGQACSAYSGQNPRCDGLLTFRAERQLF